MSPPTVEVIQVAIGGLEVRKAPAILTTLLGSCVAVVMQDQTAQIGGLAHVVRPHEAPGASGRPGYFADTAVPALLDGMLRAGARRNRIMARITGGSEMLETASGSSIGDKNRRALTDELNMSGITFGGFSPFEGKGCFVILDLSSGRLMVDPLGSEDGAQAMRSRRAKIAQLVERVSR